MGSEFFDLPDLFQYGIRSSLALGIEEERESINFEARELGSYLSTSGPIYLSLHNLSSTGDHIC